MKKNKIQTFGMIDLAQPRLGSKIHYRTDDFFAPASRIINSNEPIWKEGVYDINGKWMDGWETRRKRNKGNDFLIISLGRPGRISKINIDTSFFNGNQPQFASLEGCYSENYINYKIVKWKTILKKSKIKPDNHNFFNCSNKNIFTHVKLNIYPDGGVARLRLFGKIAIEKMFHTSDEIIELSSILNGSSIIGVNNEHFGKAENVLAPGKAINMGDGWETRRRRAKGNDWLIFKFGFTGIVNRIMIDTSHFKGNYPDYFSLQASYIPEKKLISNKQIINKSIRWEYLIQKEKLQANREHVFYNNLLVSKPVNYLKINIFPDGGISRINIFGKKKYTR